MTLDVNGHLRFGVVLVLEGGDEDVEEVQVGPG
jgi:hypothetical protein